MRSTHEAIMIGIETALVDDPLLTVRLNGVDRKPWRVVLDTNLRLPLRSRLATSARAIADPDHRRAGRAEGNGRAPRGSRGRGRVHRRRRRWPRRSFRGFAEACGARSHARLQRGRPPDRRPPDRARPCRRGRPLHRRKAARPAGLRRRSPTARARSSPIRAATASFSARIMAPTSCGASSGWARRFPIKSVGNRHCERSEAIHGPSSPSFDPGLLRRFTPRNDGL